jgi:hypothetical protein
MLGYYVEYSSFFTDSDIGFFFFSKITPFHIVTKLMTLDQTKYHICILKSSFTLW